MCGVKSFILGSLSHEPVVNCHHLLLIGTVNLIGGSLITLWMPNVCGHLLICSFEIRGNNRAVCCSSLCCSNNRFCSSVIYRCWNIAEDLFAFRNGSISEIRYWCLRFTFRSQTPLQLPHADISDWESLLCSCSKVFPICSAFLQSCVTSVKS